MPSRALPNLGLRAFYDLGEDGWDDEVSLNFLKLSILSQAGAISKVSATPGAPTDGDVHIFDETHPTQANVVAVYDVDTWKYFTPLEGWLVYNRAMNYFELFSGTTWAEFAAGGGSSLPEVRTVATATDDLDPADSGHYQRWTDASAKTLTVQPEATTAQPANGEWHIRNVGANNLTIVAGSGVTITPPAGGTLVIAPGGTVTLKRVAEDAFDLMGQVVAA